MLKVKQIIIIFLILIFFSQNVFAVEEIIEEEKEVLGISKFIEEAEKYTKESFPDLDINELMNKSIKGEINLGFLKNIFLNLIGEETRVAIKLMISVLIVIIINSICKAIIENLGNEETTKIIYFLQYMIIVMLVLSSFKEILFLTKETISKIVNFMNLLIPLFTTLMLTTGCITSSNIIQPVLIFFINFIGNFCNNFLIPMSLILIAMTIVSNISEKVQVSSIAKFLKSSIIWFLGIVLTVFTCLLSLEGTLSSSVDGLTAKTTKAAVANLIPVVGKILGDTVETVIGCSNILKNSVGFIGVIIILGIVAVPIIKLIIFTMCFKFTAAIGETVAEAKIVKLISRIS